MGDRMSYIEDNGYFVFDGVKSSDYGVWIHGGGTYNAPRRQYTEIIVPGRNGALTIDKGAYEEMNHPYFAFIPRGFDDNIAAFRNEMMSRFGRKRLYDSYHQDEFYSAKFMDGLDVNVAPGAAGGDFELVFRRDPRRFLYSGEEWNEYEDGDSLHNPTLFGAKPCIVVEGYGTLTVGHNVIEINEHIYPYIVIDSEIMDCYAASDLPLDNSAVVGTDVLKSGNYLGNANMIVSFTAGDFPVFPAGSTGVEFDNTITGVWICPRWWQL